MFAVGVYLVMAGLIVALTSPPLSGGTIAGSLMLVGGAILLYQIDHNRPKE